MSHKKVERLWCEEALQLPHRHKKRKRLYHKDSSVIGLKHDYEAPLNPPIGSTAVTATCSVRLRNRPNADRAARSRIETPMA